MAEVKFFDPNGTGAAGPLPPGLPYIDNVFSADQYARAVVTFVEGRSTRKAAIDSLAKALRAPPDLSSFAKLSLVPMSSLSGVLEWPGIPPSALRKLTAENHLPRVVEMQRAADIGRYADLSTHPWKPGWCIEMRKGRGKATAAVRKAIEEAQAFLLNCSVDTLSARQRDANQLKSFRSFLNATTRDSLRYDLVSVWTDMTPQGKVQAFKALPAFSTRLVDPVKGLNGDKSIIAVGVDEAGSVRHKFTRTEIFTAIRNERTDAEVAGYGYPEDEMLLTIVQAFTNAFQMNAEAFTKNSTKNGILLAKGMWNQRHLDVLSAIYANLKSGVDAMWSLPVMPVPANGGLEILDFSRMDGNEVYYQDFINMLAGLYCLVKQFPVDRLGYRTSGKGKDTVPNDSTTAGVLVDQADPGLAPLLGFHEQYINDYIIFPNWPDLQFRFQGKNPKEDARQYEAKLLSSSLNEKRALVDLPPIEEEASDPETKLLAKLMGISPTDPGLAGVFQTLASTLLKSKLEPAQDEATPGARFPSKTDPGTAIEHGHEAGVRRDSATEASSATAKAVAEPEDIRSPDAAVPEA